METPMEVTLLCDWCACDESTKGQATKRCHQCSISFCDSCFQTYHPMRGPFEKHSIQTPAEAVASTPSQAITCPDHVGKELDMYCVPCQKFICYLCDRGLGGHHEHKVYDIETAFAQRKAYIQQQANQLQEKNRQGERFIDKLQQEQIACENNYTQAERMVSEEFQELYSILKTIETKVKGQLAIRKQQKLTALATEIQTVTEASAGINDINKQAQEALTENDPMVFLSKTAQLETSLLESENVELKLTSPTRCDFPFIHNYEHCLKSVQSLSFNDLYVVTAYFNKTNKTEMATVAKNVLRYEDKNCNKTEEKQQVRFDSGAPNSQVPSDVSNPSESQSVFGTSRATDQPVFGASSDGKPLFGASSLSGQSPFGGSSSNSQPIFGASFSEGRSCFGISTTNQSLFGTSSASKPTSLTGQSVSGTANPLFGASSTGQFSFGASSTGQSVFGNTSSADLSVSSTSGGECSSGASSSAGQSIFGASSSSDKPAFGSSRSSDKPAFSFPSLGKTAFGPSPSSDKPVFGSSSSGKTAFGSSSSSDKPDFSFGSPSSGKLAFGSSPSSSKPAFGSSSSSDKPAFSFSPSSSKPAFNSPLSSKPVFGSSSSSQSPFSSVGKKTGLSASSTEGRFSFGASSSPGQSMFGGASSSDKPAFGSSSGSQPLFSSLVKRPVLGTSSFRAQSHFGMSSSGLNQFSCIGILDKPLVQGFNYIEFCVHKVTTGIQSSELSQSVSSAIAFCCSSVGDPPRADDILGDNGGVTSKAFHLTFHQPTPSSTAHCKLLIKVDGKYGPGTLAVVTEHSTSYPNFTAGMHPIGNLEQDMDARNVEWGAIQFPHTAVNQADIKLTDPVRNTGERVTSGFGGLDRCGSSTSTKVSSLSLRGDVQSPGHLSKIYVAFCLNTPCCSIEVNENPKIPEGLSRVVFQ